MRPLGTDKQLAERRKRGLALLRQGKTPREVAAALGVTERSVRRWRQDSQHPKHKTPARPPGRPSRLSPKQLKRLEQELQRGAFAHGYGEDYWTLDRVAHLIWELFGERYHPSGVWHLLHRLGWSSQKPQRLSLQRVDEDIVQWRRNVWPRIKKAS